ncbi:hypothetical protein V8F20_006698 [Naviculisporaceae sp. PSN 640]
MNTVHYDKDLVHSIVDETPILHVAFNPSDPATEPFPAVLPMLGCTGVFPDQTSSSSEEQEPETAIYLHGYVSSRLMKYPCGSEQGSSSPVTISAALLDGLVLSLTPFHNSCNYRSAIIFGHAHIVTSEAEKLWALELITENIIKGRWNGSRVPPTKPEMTSTSILKVEIQSASAKVREGGPSEDRKDLKDTELRERTWTGVVPAWIQWGEPIPPVLIGLWSYLASFTSVWRGCAKYNLARSGSLFLCKRWLMSLGFRCGDRHACKSLRFRK